jgi:hypothetical protein
MGSRKAYFCQACSAVSISPHRPLPSVFGFTCRLTESPQCLGLIYGMNTTGESFRNNL